MASRKQRLRKFLYEKAKKGYFSTKIKIYPSEIISFRRQGFIVEELKSNLYGDLVRVKISWKFENIKNKNSLSYAEELCMIALKKINSKCN